jgi:FixJ family two-component response regulator
MPELSGPELAAQIASLRPGIKIIFTSGYTDDAIARQGILDPTVAFIQKPYRPKALAKRNSRGVERLCFSRRKCRGVPSKGIVFTEVKRELLRQTEQNAF